VNRVPFFAMESMFGVGICRLNSGSNYYGNLMLDWWFYDPKGTGTGASNYGDYVALAEYVPVSTTNDFTTTTFTQFNQRVSLGANNVTGFHLTNYQARIVGATGGLTNGWFNTAATRSVGWHHARCRRHSHQQLRADLDVHRQPDQYLPLLHEQRDLRVQPHRIEFLVRREQHRRIL
jgi:hypothetical protein